MAATFYVDNSNPNCTDSGLGTEAQPYCTISAAVAAHRGPNITILVKPGTYRESVSLSGSGSAGNPYVIQALGGPVVIDGADDFSLPAQWMLYTGSVYRAALVSWEPKQVFVDGVRLTPSTVTPGVLPVNSFVWVSGQGLYVNIGGSSPGTHNTLVGRRTKGIYLAARTYVTIDGFTVTHIEDRAIYLNTGSNNCIVRNNTTTWNYKYGVYVTGCTGVLVEKNVSSDNQDHGLMLTNSASTPSTNCTVQDNESMRNWYPTSRRATGLLVYSSPGNFVKRNLFHDNQDSGLQLDTGSNNNVCVQNISWNNGDHGFDQVSAAGCSHTGDVAYNNFKDGFSIEGTSPNSSTYDCIAIDNGLTTNEFDLWVNDASSPGFASDRNLFWNSTTRNPIKFITTQYATIAAFTAATGRDAHSVQANPRFVNPAAGDFHLQSGSPAIDAADSSVPNWSATDARGRARVDDPATPNTGAGPVNYADMGALEYYNNLPPTAALTATPNGGTPPLPVTLDASGSYDPDGTIATYRFDFGDGSPVVGPQSSPTANHTYPSGSWTATVTVTDDGGATGSATTLVSANANQKPDGTINTPSVDLTIYAGQAVDFTSTGADPDGNLPLAFSWNMGGGAPNQAVEDPGPIIFNTPGTYTVSLVVTDNLGAADPTPATRVVTVQPAPSGQPADEIHWTFMGQTAVSFDWRGFDSSMRYGLTPSYGQTMNGVTPSPLPNSSGGPFWEAKITGLQENTTYHYSIAGGPDHTFHTPIPRGSSDFTIYTEGDIGDSVLFWRMARLQSAIAAGNPTFVLGLGDLSYANDFGQVHVDNHFNDVMVWSRDAAYMPVWGNHDNDIPNDDLRNYKGRFDLPNPQTSTTAPPIDCCGEDWSWFDYGNVRFISYPEPYNNNTWTDWNNTASGLMDQAQNDPAIKFIVTFGHRPAYSSGVHFGEGQLKNYLDQLGATHNKYVLNLNGHSHDYERSYPQNGVVHVTVGTGGAHLEQTTDPNCLWPQGCPPPAWSAYRAMHHGVLRLHVTSSEIQLAFICGPGPDLNKNLNDVSCVEGSVLDSYTIGDQAPVVTAPATSSGAEGQALAINVTASDADGDAISSLAATGLPTGATFTAGPGNTSGTLNWTPAFDQAGSYTVTFTASNGASGSASTTITVAATDRPPVVTVPASSGALVNSPMTLNVDASDPDGDAISSLTASGLPTGATFTPGSGNATGTLSWTPGADQVGTFTVTFTAQNALSSSASTTITVSPEARPPVVTVPATASVRATSLLTVNLTAADPDGEAITSLTADLSALPAGATFTAGPNNATGALTWTPASPGGPYPVTFTANNGAGESGSATTVITVTQADQAPVVTATATASAAENSPLTVNVTAADPEGDPITSLTAAGLPPGATFSAGSGNTSGTLSWTPTFSQAGSYTVTFTVANALSGSATTVITVTNVDRAPVVTAPATSSGKAGTSIVVNVTAADADGESITTLSATGVPAGATFTPGSENTSGSLSWTPTSGQVGSYTVTFTASNALSGSATTVITVTPPNTPPTAALTLTPSSGNAPLAVTADASGSTDADGSVVSYRFDFGDGTIVGPQSSPVAAHTYAVGNWTATVTVTDNGGATGSISKPVTANQPPPTNLVGNPSFESNLNNWKAYASCTVTRVSGGSAGSFSAQAAATGTTTSSFGFNDSPDWVTNTTAVGRRYRFSAWVKSSTHTGAAKINVKEYLISTGALLGQVLTTGVTLSPTWQQITVDYTTTSTGSTLDFNIKDYPLVAGEIFQVDDISIYDVTGQAAPASLTPGAPVAEGDLGVPALQPRFFPDPFRSNATLSFATSRRGPLHVDLFDMAGRRVRQLVHDPDAPAGMHRFTIRGDEGGEPLRPGIYLYRIEAVEGRKTGRVVMLR